MAKHGRGKEKKRVVGQPKDQTRQKIKPRYEQREIRDSVQQYESISTSGRR